jgi:hypothetical protein
MNSLFTIQPYWYNNTWVFDDESRGLVKEPFVAGIPEIITSMVDEAGVKDAREGFRLLFSVIPFPGSSYELRKGRSEHGGTWYSCPQTGTDGWLCPALFKFFPFAPPVLYGKAEALGDETDGHKVSLTKPKGGLARAIKGFKSYFSG